VEAKMKTRATGHIEVKTYEPQPYDEPGDGPSLAEIHVSETFTGDIEGEGVVRFPAGESRRRVGELCRHRARDGRTWRPRGLVPAPRRGHLEGTTVKGEWFVIADSGTGELAGLRGEGGFEAEFGQHASITLDYWFE
jgi:Protein of unknown function (DUF3224)